MLSRLLKKFCNLYDPFIPAIHRYGVFLKQIDDEIKM